MRFGVATVLMIGALSLMGRTAEAQARGTVQATATVVDTRQGFEALATVRQVVTGSRETADAAGATVAQVSTARPAADPSRLIVTVDFSRN
jgi:hypothetical protein